MSHYRESFRKTKDTDVRGTPQPFFDYWNKLFCFQLDVCASHENAKCSTYYSEKEDGLSQEWAKINWCNPPYSGGQIERWLKKGAVEQQKGRTTVFLLPCDTSTGWYHDNIETNPMCSKIPVRGRLKFNGKKSPAPFGSTVVIFWGLMVTKVR